MELGSPVFPGDILTDEQLAGRDVSILTRFKYAEFVNEENPNKSAPTPKRIETIEAPSEVEETSPVVEETSDEPVKAVVSKHGVWYKVFAGSMQVGKPTRDEKEAKKIAKEFNAKL